jgi:hypothetical protein
MRLLTKIFGHITVRPQRRHFGLASFQKRFYYPTARTSQRPNQSPMSLPVNTIIKFVPQQHAWVVERFGKFHRILEPGLAILLPFIDQIRYVKTLKEVAVEIPSQAAITQDNVTINMDGILYYRVVDPFKVHPFFDSF